jgi:alpha-mannosidase
LQDDCIENEFLRVRLHPDGRFDLTDKTTGQVYRGLNMLEDVADAGDEYDWSPAENGACQTSEGIAGTLSVVSAGGLRGSLETTFDWPLPAALTQDRSSRGSMTATCAVRVRVTLDASQSLVDVDTRFDNRSDDHRLRAVFPTGLNADRLVSDGHFQVHERALDRPSGEDWVQPPPATLPQQEFSAVQAGGNGLALFARGLPEIEATRSASGTAMHLTLLRAVGWLSRDDFPTRRHCNAGPTLATPAAQCHGEHCFRYAVRPFAGDWVDAGIPAESRRWRVEPPAIQGVAAGHRRGGVELVRLESGRLRVTAIKRHETRETLVVRLHNMTDQGAVETLVVGLRIRAAWHVDLLEERQGPIEFADRALQLDVAPYKIVTLEIEFAT